ncbi:MAG: DUF4255 domain-containing protein [Pseudomonadota bacterium]
MKTWIRAASVTLRELLREALEGDVDLDAFFSPAQGGTMVVTLDTPEEMVDLGREGVSLWLYRLQRDGETLNQPPRRVAPGELRPRPLPLRLHYLVTPIVDHATRPQAPELEQHVLGKVLQVLHDVGSLRGALLRDDLVGQAMEIFVRLEPLTLEEITRVWDALELPYQLCVSYEVSVVPIHSGRAVEDTEPVDAVHADYGLATPLEGAP